MGIDETFQNKRMMRKGPGTDLSEQLSWTGRQSGQAGLRRGSQERGKKGAQGQRVSSDRGYGQFCTGLKRAG